MTIRVRGYSSTEVASTADYHALGSRLRAQGFSEQPTAQVLCRWAKGALLIDVMPTHASVLGFTNSWYAAAVRSAARHLLPSGRSLRLVSAPVFLATKLEAFASRGQGDFLHHDIEDIVTLVDGRASLHAEVQSAEPDVREFLMDEFDLLLADTTFVERMSWHLSPQDQHGRKDIVLGRMREIAGL